jgi:hypothetical protein
MVATTNDGPILLFKKLGGLIAILFGCILTAIGMTYESSGTTVIGILLLALGAVLLTLKIIRRNQGSQLP